MFKESQKNIVKPAPAALNAFRKDLHAFVFLLDCSGTPRGVPGPMQPHRALFGFTAPLGSQGGRWSPTWSPAMVIPTWSPTGPPTAAPVEPHRAPRGPRAPRGASRGPVGPLGPPGHQVHCDGSRKKMKPPQKIALFGEIAPRGPLGPPKMAPLGPPRAPGPHRAPGGGHPSH